MICHPLEPRDAKTLTDTIERMVEQTARRSEQLVQNGELSLEALAELMSNCVKIGELKAIRDHNDIAIQQSIRNRR